MREEFNIMQFNNNKGECEFPFVIEKIDPDLNQQMLNDFKGKIYSISGKFVEKFLK